MASDQGRPDDPDTDPAAASAGDDTPPRQRDLEDDPSVAGGGSDPASASPPDDSGPERRRGLLVRLFQGTVALAAVAAFLAVVWYAYTWGTGQGGGDGGGLPVVEAPSGPEKVKPDDPGGMEVEHQDKVVLNDEAAEGEVERLLPPPETPRPPEPAPAAEGAETAAQDGAAEPAGAAGPADTGETADGSGAASDGAASEGADVAASDADALPEQEVAELPETTPPDGGAGGEAADTPDAGGTDAADGQAAEPAAEPEAEPEPAQPAAERDGAYAVQLAAFRDEAGARAAWDRFRERYPELLGDLQLLLQRTEIEGRGTFWRVRTGPFQQKSAADGLCAKLKDRGQDCLSVGR
jgi:cell division septation protein DedD